jgi:hypothetical protein
MTRQTHDTLSNNGHVYSILEVEGGDLYQPPNSLPVVSMSTACWKGFNCKYKVLTENGDLLLTDLVMRTEDRIYPPLHGVNPIYDGFHFGTRNEPVDRTNVSYCIGVYEGLNLPMSHFTGRIMLGTNFIQTLLSEHYDATSYQHVWEIHVDQGRVTQALDLSEQVATRRRQNESSDGYIILYHPFSWDHDRILREIAEGGDGGLSGDEDDL